MDMSAAELREARRNNINKACKELGIDAHLHGDLNVLEYHDECEKIILRLLGHLVDRKYGIGG